MVFAQQVFNGLIRDEGQAKINDNEGDHHLESEMTTSIHDEANNIDNAGINLIYFSSISMIFNIYTKK